MWGNDPKLTQAAYDSGQKPVESWINPRADAIRKSLGGKRPTWGWNGRLNGPGKLSLALRSLIWQTPNTFAVLLNWLTLSEPSS